MFDSFKFFLFIVINAIFIINITKCEIDEKFRWKQYAYDLYENDERTFDDPEKHDQFLEEKKIAQESEYIAYSNVPLGAANYKDRMFIAIPRFNPGVPGTLSYFNSTSPKGSSPLLRAYPSYKANQIHPQLEKDIHRIVSVYRVRADICDRLWFVDTGMLEYSNNVKIVQRPSLWIIDLKTDELIRRYEIPENIAEQGNGFISVNVDVEKTDCDNAYAYLPNMKLGTLNVYSFKKDHMWSFKHKSFEVVPDLAIFNVKGIEFSWKDAVFSTALSRKNTDGYRTVYYHPMSSITEYTVSSKVLQNEELTKEENLDVYFKALGERGVNSQSPMHDIDLKTGVIFYGHVTLNGVSCWNTARRFSPYNHILFAQDNETMVYTADLQVDLDGVLWYLTNNMPIFSYGKLNTDEYNFRIWSQTAAIAIKGTHCESYDEHHDHKGSCDNPQHHHHHHHHHHYHHYNGQDDGHLKSDNVEEHDGDEKHV